MILIKKESLIEAFKEEIKHANQMTFPIAVDSFTNLWQYEFGSFEDLPNDIDHLIAHRAIELGLME
jgi:hypothetical protein